MNPVSDGKPGDDLVYLYRPSLLGAPWSFRLTPAALAWEVGRRSGLVPYRDIRRVRLSFKPVGMQRQRYQTEIWADGAPKLTLVSSSWKSMVEQERQDDSYSAFVTALHRRLAEAGAPAVYEKGGAPLRYWPGVVVFFAISLGLAYLTVRALLSHGLAPAAFVAAFLALFVWQSGGTFRRNRPGVYSPDALPELLLPRTTSTEHLA